MIVRDLLKTELSNNEVTFVVQWFVHSLRGHNDKELVSYSNVGQGV